ncbi:hypothetical protein [Endozoicomonas sp. 8E]|uniref:hypothetical protein n=1 Tax=Endozoicomonas sp. 8E TaxID=3035692 RepID=UPI0029395239|nr:hypothetical protein [Endozoicomonas sp. 8E]WOG27620.1 hypothetical protein P6910_24240 [Endozoicomonas sp. 8E]
MANPPGAATSAHITDPGVQIKDMMSGDHPDSVAEYSLYRCSALSDPLSKMRKGITVEELPEHPLPCRLLSEFKCLDRRTVSAHPFLKDSTENRPGVLSKINAANGYGVWAELANMDQERRAYYHRLCQLRSQLCESLNVARQVENSLENDISFYIGVLQGQHKDQEALPVMGSKFSQALTAHLDSLESALHQKTTMLEAQDRQFHEMDKKIQKLTQQAVHSKNKAFEAAGEQVRTIQTIELVTQLENELRESHERVTLMQKELDEVRIEKNSAEVALRNIHERLRTQGFQKLNQELAQARRDQHSLQITREHKNELFREVKMLKEEKGKQYEELFRVKQKLLETERFSNSQQVESEKMQKAMQENNDVLSRRAERLEGELAEARRCSDAHLALLNKMQEEKAQQSRGASQRENESDPKTTARDYNQEQLSELELENNVLLRQLAYSRESLNAEKEKRSQLENDLQQTRSLLQQKEDEVIAWINQSRQWNTARAAMEKEIQNLMDKLSMLLQNNQSEEMEVSQDNS